MGKLSLVVVYEVKYGISEDLWHGSVYSKTSELLTWTIKHNTHEATQKALKYYLKRGCKVHILIFKNIFLGQI